MASENISTPVLFLIFNRPDNTRQVFEQIRLAKPAHLYIAADGARSHVSGETEICEETRSIVNEIDWDCDVRTLFRDENLGCKYAVSSAITWFFEQVEEGIILEDDCLPNEDFFLFCQQLLEKYRIEEHIHLVSGNNFIIEKEYDESYYFSKYPHIWGWATWRRAWEKYDVSMKTYSSEILNTKEFQQLFNNKSEKKYWRNIFELCKAGQINTWDYQLTYSIWKNNGMCITPNENLVVNLGLNIDSTHFFLNDSFKMIPLSKMTFPLIHPVNIVVDKETDIYTFNNLFAHSFSRGLRLFKENRIRKIIGYFLKKYL